jgi:hypothetical protein
MIERKTIETIEQHTPHVMGAVDEYETTKKYRAWSEIDSLRPYVHSRVITVTIETDQGLIESGQLVEIGTDTLVLASGNCPDQRINISSVIGITHDCVLDATPWCV